MNDTTCEMTEKMHEMIHQKTPSDRCKMGCSMIETSKHLIGRAILEKDPLISAVNFQKELFIRFYQDDFSLAEREKIFAYFDQRYR